MQGTEKQIEFANKIIDSLSEINIPETINSGDYNTKIASIENAENAEHERANAQMLKALRDYGESGYTEAKESLPASIRPNVVCIKRCRTDMRPRRKGRTEYLDLDAAQIISFLKKPFYDYVVEESDNA